MMASSDDSKGGDSRRGAWHQGAPKLRSEQVGLHYQNHVMKGDKWLIQLLSPFFFFFTGSVTFLFLYSPSYFDADREENIPPKGEGR